jgi:hypothetical protein
VSPATLAPDRISVCMYQVGFGDCILLSFHYPFDLPDGPRARHLLFDFGSTRWPKGHAGRYPEIAADVARRTDGVLDAIVITHRHKDHIGGYGITAAADTIAALKPRAVVRPWTENPKAAAEATGPTLVGPRSYRYARNLTQAQRFAGHVALTVGAQERGFRGDLREAALEQLANQDAINRLDALAVATANKGDYVFAGSPVSLQQLLPGVVTTVLGPPTIEMWPQVAGERADDDEYWLRQNGLLARMLTATGAPPATARLATTAAIEPEVDPGPLRWIVERLREQQTHSLLRIVGGLEDALNNTSVILLFQTGRRTLLFPGDAQIENWSYTLTSPKATALRAALPQVDLYKVGHHGSRNASPRSLVKQWVGRNEKLTSIMSTLPGVHGKSDATAVPRTTLVDALAALGPLYRTDKLAATALAVEVTGSAKDNQPFTR